MLQHLTPQIAIGTAQTASELAEVASQGFKSVIDLCGAAEPKKIAAEALPSSIGYHSLPVSPQSLRPELLTDFAALLDAAPAPVYVRCASGLRAGVLTLLTLAQREHWSAATYTQERDRLGLSHRPDCPLEDFAATQLASLA